MGSLVTISSVDVGSNSSAQWLPDWALVTKWQQWRGYFLFNAEIKILR